MLVLGPRPWSGALFRCGTRPHARTWCAGARPAVMLGAAVSVLGAPPWSQIFVLSLGLSPSSGMLCCCTAHCRGQACCAGAAPVAIIGLAVLVLGPPPWLGVLCWCGTCPNTRTWCAGARPAVMVGAAVAVLGAPPWSGVLCFCWTICHGRLRVAGVWPAAVVLCGGTACCRLWPRQVPRGWLVCSWVCCVAAVSVPRWFHLFPIVCAVTQSAFAGTGLRLAGAVGFRCPCWVVIISLSK